jgi:hypothetical protein
MEKKRQKEEARLEEGGVGGAPLARTDDPKPKTTKGAHDDGFCTNERIIK